VVTLLVVPSAALITDGDFMFVFGGRLLADHAEEILLVWGGQFGQVLETGPAVGVVAELDEALVPDGVHLDDGPQVVAPVLLFEQDVLAGAKVGLLLGRRGRIRHCGLVEVRVAPPALGLVLERRHRDGLRGRLHWKNSNRSVRNRSSDGPHRPQRARLPPTRTIQTRRNDSVHTPCAPTGKLALFQHTLRHPPVWASLATAGPRPRVIYLL
jgi:hypothetical protein